MVFWSLEPQFFMRPILLLVASLFITMSVSFADAPLQPVSFVLGPKKFIEGDEIVIDEVLTTSPEFKPGQKIIVRGNYRMGSTDKATLALFMTAMNGDGKTPVAPTQTMSVSQSVGRFEFTYEIKQEGALHVSFYSVPGGKPFGGVYFGTQARMDEIKGWKLSDYEAEVKK